MRRPVLPRGAAALFAAVLLLAGTVLFGQKPDPPRSERPAHGSESAPAIGSGVLRPASSDRAELLRDWGRRDRGPSGLLSVRRDMRGPSGLFSVVAVLASGLPWLLLAATRRIAAGAAGRSLRGIARSFAARSPPLFRPI
jgi:hypothetical protein